MPHGVLGGRGVPLIIMLVIFSSFRTSRNPLHALLSRGAYLRLASSMMRCTVAHRCYTVSPMAVVPVRCAIASRQPAIVLAKQIASGCHQRSGAIEVACYCRARSGAIEAACYGTKRVAVPPRQPATVLVGI